MYKLITTVRLKEPEDDEKYPRVEGTLLILNKPAENEEESEENGED